MVRHYLLLSEYEKMNCLPLVLYLSLLISVLSSLPAPVNVSVDSLNFHHVLRWDPGPGTPPGTRYNIYRMKQLLNSTTTTSIELTLDVYETHRLTVQASNNQTLSKVSQTTFTAFSDTKIGPPELSLTRCGNCIQISISLPEPDIRSGVKDIQKLYDPKFTVLWRKEEEEVFNPRSYITRNKTSTLNNLEKGVKYCIQVKTDIRTNKNTKRTAWKCIFTSTVEPRRDVAVLGAVATLLIVVISVLMISMFCLYYSGFLCKLQETWPRALITSLTKGYTLTPEKTIPDLVSISSETENHNTNDANLEEEEVVEEELYINRNAELSSGESSTRNSGSMLVSSKAAVSADYKSLTERMLPEVEVPATEFEVGVLHVALDQNEGKAEGARVSFMPEEGQTGVQGHVTNEEEMKEKVEVCESSGNVNLFSVTLAALTVGEEEGQNTRDFLKLSDPEPLLTSSNTDSETESDDQTAVETIQPTHEYFTGTGYKGRHAGTEVEEEKEDIWHMHDMLL